MFNRIGVIGAGAMGRGIAQAVNAVCIGQCGQFLDVFGMQGGG